MKISKFIENLGKGEARLDFGLNQLRELDYGATRVVFEIESGPLQGNVIKFARTSNACSMNRSECQLWEESRNTSQEQYLCPIVDYDSASYKWVVMEKADMNVPYQETRDFREEVRDAFSGKQLDLATCNIGRHRGRLKLVDYPMV